MKTISSFSSKLLALTLALMASVASFAYDEMPDFQVDGLYYNFLEGDNVEVTHPYRPEMPTEGTSTTAIQDLYDDYAELTELTIPSTISYEGKVYNVIRIGYAAFDQCNLTYVDIPSSIKTIGVAAFSNCSSLTSITLKEGLEHIEGNAFADCRLLETIIFPNSLKTVGSYAFSFTSWYNNQPNGGVYAGNVFYKYKGDIPQNTSFVIKEGTVSISPDAFIKENRRIDYGLVDVAIPNSVEIIGEYAFSQCRALRSVNIPHEVTTIESYAFSYCKSLTSVTCEIVEPLSLPSDVFFSASVANATLYVPAESVDEYKNAEQWKEFGQILPIKPLTAEDLFPALWGLQRTEVEFHIDGAGAPSLVSFNEYTPTLVNGKWYLYDGRNYLREEKSQVLLYSPEFEIYEDVVLYDWALEIGDTLPFTIRPFDDDKMRGAVFRVTDVSTITLLDGKEYKKWTLACGIEYIEGIGAINGEGFGNYFCIQHTAHPATYIETRLVCASRNGQLLYQMDDAEMERLGAECLCEAENPEDLFPTLWGLQRTGCTKTIGENGNGTTVWGSRSYLMQEIETATIDGKQYLLFGTNNIYDEYCSLWLREENNKILLYSTAQKKDLVLYDFTLNVGDSLPRLYVDYDLSSVVDYDNDEWGLSPLVVTEVSTITLLDGKEYKKWTFDNGIEYVEGIGSFGSNYGHNDFYQLIVNAPRLSDVYSQHLVCASKNGQLLYQMDDTEMERLGAECLCDYDSGHRKDNAKDGQIGGRPTPTQWNQLEVVLREMDNNHTILQAETFSYTLEDISQQVNNKTYFQLARQSTKDTATTKSVVGALHFGKDEDNRVYFLRDGVEYVLYDFTAEPGDTIEIFAGINNYPQDSTYTHVVTGKDTLENGACRMLLEVVFSDETATAENAEKVWLAGLGSVDGIVHNAAKRVSNAHAAPSRTAHSSDTQTSVMLCAWREDSCLYTTDHPDYDSFGCVYNQDPTSIEDTHSPSPIADYQKLLRNGQLLIIHNGKTYNVLGIAVE